MDLNFQRWKENMSPSILISTNYSKWVQKFKIIFYWGDKVERA